MNTWLIDLCNLTGHQVTVPSPISDPLDQRYRKVSGTTLQTAVERAQREASVLRKLQTIQSGSTSVMSDSELDLLIDLDVYPSGVVSIPNPERCGILDAYLVAQKSHPSILRYAEKVQAQYNAIPAIRAYQKQLAASD